jgi:uroporphyrinogen decarboxylase
MNLKPDFNRFLTALTLRGEPDRVPLAEASIDYDVKCAFLGRPIQGIPDEVEFWLKAGYDFVPIQGGFREVFWPHYLSNKKGAEGMTRKLQGDYTVYQGGTTTRAWAPEGKGLITNWEEFRAFPWPRAEDLDYSIIQDLKPHLPPGMKAVVYMGYIYTSTWWLMGFETFCFALRENMALVEAVQEKIKEIQSQALEKILTFDHVEAIWHPDDIAYSEALIVSPAYLRKYVFPWYKRANALCRQRGIPSIYHSDGKLLEVIPDIIDCGFSGLHPIEPKAMDIAELKRNYGKKLCLIGNIDLGYTLTRGTPAEVEDEVKVRIRKVGPGGGYCVGSSNSVTSYVPLANFNAMREATFKYGRYPLQF